MATLQSVPNGAVKDNCTVGLSPHGPMLVIQCGGGSVALDSDDVALLAQLLAGA